MSLDVWLLGPEQDCDCTCANCGNIHVRRERETFFSANITHNLSKMADHAGVYDILWCPKELGIVKASEITLRLQEGILKMKANPDLFKQYDPPNKWGSYDNFIPWLERYLEACKQFPDAEIGISK